MREILEARYSTTDFYIVCIMSCSDAEQEINIIDKREIFQAKWAPLTELTSNTDGETQYKMFPNAWKFLKFLNQRITLYKQGKLPVIQDPSSQPLSATELIKQITMTYEEMPPASGKGKPVRYYI